MKGTIKQSGKEERVKKNKETGKYLDRILEGNLKNPPPSIIEKISAELGVDLLSKSDE